MSATPTPAAVLLAELNQRGFELQIHGERLRYRPRSAMTPDLAERIRRYKGELMAILLAVRRRLTQTPRSRAAKLIREARRDGNRELAAILRDAWRERIAICEIDGGLSTEAAEEVAGKNIQSVLDSQDSSPYNSGNESDS